MIESYIYLNELLIMYSKRLIHPNEREFPLLLPIIFVDNKK